MDNQYLLLLRKDDIIDLYRYGNWKAMCPSIKFDGTVESLANNKNLMKKLFKQANPFGYSMDYFLIHTKSPKVSPIEVDDIVDIFALDKESYKIGLSLSPEIRLSEPIFEQSYVDFQIENEITNSINGIDNVLSIFDINKPKSFLKKPDLEIIIRDSFLDAPIEGNKCIWYYLLRYGRHHSYPNDNRGYALDALHALFNFQKKKDMDIPVTQSNLGKDIIALEPSISYNNILIEIEKRKDFLKQCEKIQKGYYKIAPLFLTLKDVFAEGIHDDRKYFGRILTDFIKVMKDNYNNDDLAKALYLLGIVLGRENTYQYIYKRSNLFILK